MLFMRKSCPACHFWLSAGLIDRSRQTNGLKGCRGARAEGGSLLLLSLSFFSIRGVGFAGGLLFVTRALRRGIGYGGVGIEEKKEV